MAKYKPKEIKDWFIGKARTAAGYRKKIIGNSMRSRSDPAIGKMFFFYYDPKHKETLPMYDKFPMVFPIQEYNDGFLGLNLHYLSVDERRAIIGKLSEFANNKRFDATTRLRLSYDLLQSSKRLSTLARPCIKRYLFSHVRSMFIEITADEWDKVIELPVEMFVYNR
jgi:hypothetical protein